MGMVRASPEEMESLSSQFRQKGDELDQLRNTIANQLNSTDWEGAAATRFRDDWNGKYQQALEQIRQGLQACSQELTQRAELFRQAGQR